MKVNFKTIIKAWLISASMAAAINLLWFYINTMKSGNPWSDVIGVVPILFMSFITILVGSVVYWLLNLKLKRADIIFKIGAIVLTIMSVMGHPKLSNGTVVPPEFRIIDMPMQQKWLIWIKTLNEKHHFITGESLERNGKQVTGIDKVVSDYNDHKNIITGFCIVKAKNINEAIEASFSCPIYDIDGSIEIRQIREAI